MSIAQLWGGLLKRWARHGLVSSILALLAFLPIAGLALLSPGQVQATGEWEYFLAGLLLARIMTPAVAVMVTSYLARKEPEGGPPPRSFLACFLPSAGLILGVALFGSLASLLFVVPGVVFALTCCIVLPVFVNEEVNGPGVVKRSWELTKDHRWELLGFWASFYLVCSVVLGVIAKASTHSGLDVRELPLVQSEAFLPLVLAAAVLYGAQIIASHEIYQRLTASPLNTSTT